MTRKDSKNIDEYLNTILDSLCLKGAKKLTFKTSENTFPLMFVVYMKKIQLNTYGTNTKNNKPVIATYIIRFNKVIYHTSNC
ncbi:TPA: hypothetical protein PQ873_002566 [Staphylococcus aureus]|uniref:hypothetical protein n=1 Tax=Staphylococcus aureus TaxID=1280 RepID=UPI0019816B2E|nr:hypothetical protein [Staphylococcus aureus]HDJ6675719.1 hypothetical protein [Staphylococcus aureus]